MGLKVWAFAAGVVLGGCSPAALLNATVPSGGATVERDVAYAPGPHHTMDVYRPATATGPLVVFLYGGAWRDGDKSIYPFVALPLAARGAVVVVPNYRMFPEVQFPGFVEDNALAVAWAMEHAAGLGADPRQVFVVGHSAGAYDAAMLALDPHYLRDAGVSRDRLAGVVGLAGPYDFLPMLGAEREVFASVQDGPLSQPVNYVDGRAPPLFLAAGTDDDVVMPRNTASLAAKVRAAGGVAEERFYPGVGHVGLVLAFAPVFRGKAPVLDDVWGFVRGHRVGG